MKHHASVGPHSNMCDNVCVTHTDDPTAVGSKGERSRSDVVGRAVLTMYLIRKCVGLLLYFDIDPFRGDGGTSREVFRTVFGRRPADTSLRTSISVYSGLHLFLSDLGSPQRGGPVQLCIFESVPSQRLYKDFTDVVY